MKLTFNFRHPKTANILTFEWKGWLFPLTMISLHKVAYKYLNDLVEVHYHTSLICRAALLALSQL
jgi:hypothetical protein